MTTDKHKIEVRITTIVDGEFVYQTIIWDQYTGEFESHEDATLRVVERFTQGIKSKIKD